ncbi:MAG TPA: hypothetical protein VIG33_04170 [Pseudobdellovibrionaceae bacterium]
MEKFLEFWSHYNAAIIESLVALILVSAIYLAYRSLFAAKEVETSHEVISGGAFNAVQIEKTLQKILDQQSSRPASLTSGVATETEVPAEILQELDFLKKALEEKEKQIATLQAKAAQVNAGPSDEQIAAAASAAAGLAEKERLDYVSKIKELEARLAEYEIISEDIADLSFFKEENTRLTKELEEARGEKPPLQSAAPEPEPSLESVVPPKKMTVPESEVLPEAEVFAEAAGSIDDSLMAEFAKAVEDQKSGAAPAADTKEDENRKLVAEFENFNKKS